jgi:NAD(P)-dependent dehydrogenase (short-subunit alcohol dehydrogenase family)
MTADDSALTGEAIRQLLYRRDTALARYRAGLARSLGVTDVEMTTLVHLAEQGALAPSTIASLLDLSSVDTPMTRPFLADARERAEIESRIPLGRLGEPEEVAQAVLFAATSPLMTGASVVVDGGWTAW